MILFEFNDTQRHLLDELDQKYHLFGYAEVEGSPFGIIVISRIPIVQKLIKRLENPKLGYVKLSFLHKNVMLNTILFHPPSPRTRDLWKQRNYLLNEVAAQSKNLQGNWLIAGDFNTVPWSHYFINISNSCFNNKGYYTTWSPFNETHTTKLFELPIDHCLASDSVQLANIQTHYVPGSDHKALSYGLSFSH